MLDPCARGCQRRATPFLDDPLRGLLLLSFSALREAVLELRLSRALPWELERFGERENEPPGPPVSRELWRCELPLELPRLVVREPGRVELPVVGTCPGGEPVPIGNGERISFSSGGGGGRSVASPEFGSS